MEYRCEDDLLDIPPFLRRDGSEPRRRPPPARRHKRRAQQRKVSKPKGNFTLYLVCFADQAPLIGSGHRRVWASVGRVWVRLVSAENGRRQKIRRREWNTLTPEALDG